MRLSMRMVYEVMYYIFIGIKKRAYDRNQCNFCQGMFISGKSYAFINANGL
jgi:hypothetical protein